MKLVDPLLIGSDVFPQLTCARHPHADRPMSVWRAKETTAPVSLLKGRPLRWNEAEAFIGRVRVREHLVLRRDTREVFNERP